MQVFVCGFLWLGGEVAFIFLFVHFFFKYQSYPNWTIKKEDILQKEVPLLTIKAILFAFLLDDRRDKKKKSFIREIERTKRNFQQLEEPVTYGVSYLLLGFLIEKAQQ